MFVIARAVVMTSVSACSAVKLQFMQQLLLLLMLAMCSLAKNGFYNFNDCKSSSVNAVIDGATVISQSKSHYSRHNTSCRVTFQARQPNQKLLLQFTRLDIKKESTCIDYITIIRVYNATYEDTILDTFCGNIDDLAGGHQLYTSTRKLYIEWTTGPGPDTQNTGFNLTLTAITQPPVLCNPKTSIQCSNHDCISASLGCDGVAHCLAGEDEVNCKNTATHTPYSIAPPPSSKAKRPRPAPATSKAPFREEVYLWLPLIVVVLFTVIMVTLILIGRKSGGHGYTSQLSRTDDQNSLRLDLNSNPGFVDSEGGVPETPPPTYSMIERQTSYVSHISQSSSQLEVPPEYDDAVDLPGTQNGQVRSRVPARQNSSGSLSRRNNTRPRIFSRSISATEPPVRSMRYAARSSSASDYTGNMESILETSHSERHRSDSEQSDVFPEIIPQSPDSQSPERMDTAPGTQPVTSTPHRSTGTDYSVDLGRSDSALLGDVSDNTDSTSPGDTELATTSPVIRFF